MFQHHCTACGDRGLVFPSQITALDNTAAGIVVSYTCWCGSAQQVLSGRRREAVAA